MWPIQSLHYRQLDSNTCLLLLLSYANHIKPLAFLWNLTSHRHISFCNYSLVVGVISNKHGIRKSDYLIPTCITCKDVLKWSIQLTR